MVTGLWWCWLFGSPRVMGTTCARRPALALISHIKHITAHGSIHRAGSGPSCLTLSACDLGACCLATLLLPWILERSSQSRAARSKGTVVGDPGAAR